MSKKAKTIDGLSVRSGQRRSIGFTENDRERKMRALGVTGVKINVKNKDRSQKVEVKELGEETVKKPSQQPKAEKPLTTEEKIEDFLEDVRDENPTDLEMDAGVGKKKKEKRSKKDKAKKKKRKWIKWVVIGVLVVAVGLLAWKGKEIWDVINGALSAATGGKVGAGDILGADPTVPLKQDANGRTNILVYGTSGHDMDSSDHDGAQLADSIMVVSLNQDEGDIKTFSIPRDLVAKGKCTSTGKMNETYWCEYQKHTRDARYSEAQNDKEELMKLRWEYEEKAGENFMEVIGEVTGLEMHYWAHVNWEALISIVDAIGGIDVAVEYQGDQDSYTGSLPVIWTTDKRGIQDRNWDWACKNTCYYVKYSNGEQVHLDGVHAIALARARGEAQPAYGTNGNWSREKNQQAILEAIAIKIKQMNIVTDLDSALDIVRSMGDNLRMSFDAEGIRRGIDLAGKMNVGAMKSIDLTSVFTNGMLPVPGVNSYECGGAVPGCLSYVMPKLGTYNYSGVAAHIAKELEGNLIEDEAARIDVLNGTSQTGLAAKISNELKDTGYSVGVVGNAPEGADYTSTVIYKVSEKSAPATEKKLLEKFVVAKVTIGLPEGVESTADYVIILGQNSIK